MTIQSIGLLQCPSHIARGAAGAWAVNPFAITASGHKFAYIISVPKTGTLDWFEYRAGTVTTFPGNGLRLSFQDLDASGNPDGSVDQFCVISSAFANDAWVIPPNVMTDDGTSGGVKRSVTGGQLLACVVDFNPTYTTGSMNQMAITNTNRLIAGLPYVDLNTGAWTKSTSSPIMALKYDDGTYPPLGYVWPLKVYTTVSFNNASTPDERGMLVNLPITVEVGGVWLDADTDGDFDLVVYDSGGSVLTSASVDKDARSSDVFGITHVQFAPVTLTAATDYRVVVKPTSGTSLTVAYVDVESAARLEVLWGHQGCAYTERTDGGAWTNTATRHPVMGLLLTGIEATGGGSPGGAHILGGTIVR